MQSSRWLAPSLWLTWLVVSVTLFMRVRPTEVGSDLSYQEIEAIGGRPWSEILTAMGLSLVAAWATVLVMWLLARGAGLPLGKPSSLPNGATPSLPEGQPWEFVAARQGAADVRVHLTYLASLAADHKILVEPNGQGHFYVRKGEAFDASSEKEREQIDAALAQTEVLLTGGTGTNFSELAHQQLLWPVWREDAKKRLLKRGIGVPRADLLLTFEPSQNKGWRAMWLLLWAVMVSSVVGMMTVPLYDGSTVLYLVGMPVLFALVAVYSFRWLLIRPTEYGRQLLIDGEEMRGWLPTYQDEIEAEWRAGRVHPLTGWAFALGVGDLWQAELHKDLQFSGYFAKQQKIAKERNASPEIQAQIEEMRQRFPDASLGVPLGTVKQLQD